MNPAGLRDVLDIADSYGLPSWVTENGIADSDDNNRAPYVVHLAVINKAIGDGLDIRGYTAWSLTDNLEWVLGYGMVWAWVICWPLPAFPCCEVPRSGLGWRVDRRSPSGQAARGCAAG